MLVIVADVKKYLFGLLRLRIWKGIIGWIFAYMSFVIPVQRLRETETLLAFHHPQPNYPVHILIVPKRPYPHLLALEAVDISLLTDLFQTVQSLVREFQLDRGGYRLITNGGIYQDIPHLHFHLIGEVPNNEKKG